MPVTPKTIVRDLRSELSMMQPNYRQVGRMITDALELLDRRIDDAESQPAPEVPQIRHAEGPEVRGRRKK
jgi:hypothetical protein